MGAIAEAAFAPFVPLVGRRPAPMDEDLSRAIADDRALVAMLDGSLAGYLTFKLSPPEAELTTVAVTPQCQGRGIGKALVADVEARARAAGARWIHLYTNAAMAENIALYPKLGYRNVGERTEEGFRRVYFSKELDPAAVTKAPVDGLYGRRKTQGSAHADPSDPRLLNLGDPCPFPVDGMPLRLEVGFGAGEHLLDHARREPGVTIIGVEPFETGLARAMAGAAREGIGNLWFHQGDARLVLDWLPAACLERVDVLYPDPWPKQRHWKRRFISSVGLDRLARALAPGAVVRFASDIPHYVAWTRSHTAAHPAFDITRDSADPWPHWPSTRYEEKALREGRTPHYLDLARR
ncbi:MAG: GNAT family N-acetyltransferase [Pseudomonadota bacterium]